MYYSGIRNNNTLLLFHILSLEEIYIILCLEWFPILFNHCLSKVQIIYLKVTGALNLRINWTLNMVLFWSCFCSLSSSQIASLDGAIPSWIVQILCSFLLKQYQHLINAIMFGWEQRSIAIFTMKIYYTSYFIYVYCKNGITESFIVRRRRPSVFHNWLKFGQDSLYNKSRLCIKYLLSAIKNKQTSVADKQSKTSFYKILNSPV